MSDRAYVLLVAMVAGPIIAYLLVFGMFSGAAKARCLELGYPSMRVDPLLNRYCVARVDQTDIVVPLAKARPR